MAGNCGCEATPDVLALCRERDWVVTSIKREGATALRVSGINHAWPCHPVEFSWQVPDVANPRYDLLGVRLPGPETRGSPPLWSA